MKSISRVFACLLLAASFAYAQGVGSSGVIRGSVADASGAVLPNVTVTIIDAHTGLRRTLTTDATGHFIATGLLPATYDISAESKGLATVIHKGVEIAVGQTVVLDFSMKPGQVSTVLEVTSEPPVVETDRGSQADQISQQYIADLPIDRRDARSIAG